jgi:hypothetical protein
MKRVLAIVVPKPVSKLLQKMADLVVLTAAIYSEIAVSAFSLFRGLVPRPDPWLRGLPREASALTDQRWA